ncbi:MAG TPA: membrane protein insertase YidC [Rudaea sp.]|jgi:YidC/Oxa1 family membrane protein insertase|uniref:membrane protein insertase YidC n=1 Tax=Rudaea sp. TaxID=2136325 RepID=UPI002F92B5BF
MTSTRPVLLFALLFVGYFIYAAWQQDYGAKLVTVPTASAPTADAPATTTPAASAADIPAQVTATATASVPVAAEEKSAPTIEVQTDVLRVAISTSGGSLVRADLLAYPIDPKDKTQPVRLLDDGAAHFFVAQSGLISNGAPAPSHKAVFSAQKNSYALAAGEDRIEVPLTWQDASGLSVRKVYVFTRGSYLIESREEISNGSSAPWTGNEYRQLQRVPPVVAKSGLFSLYNPEAYAFAGAAWYSPQDKFQKLAFAKFAESPLKREAAGGWAAMLQHYFFAAWIPAAGETDQFSTDVVPVDGTPRYLIRTVSPAVTVAPNQSATIATRLYVGPKLQSELANIAPGLELTADYGILTVISQPLHWILVQLHKLVGNWGLAIILLVLLIKLVLYKPSEAQYRSMAKMKQFQPRLQALKERYGDDKQKLNAATMELYQKEKINPLGGCLPVLIQMPIFLGLLWVLQESVELRQAPFFGWIQNLSAPDPFFILPILNGVAMMATQWLSPSAPGMDPMQARMMKTMPLIFAVMFAFAPAGLTLYWTMNGWLSLLQQWIITQRVGGAAKAKA